MTVDDDHAPHITKRRAADSKGKGKVQDNSGPVANSGSDSDDNEDWEAVEFDAVSVPSADLLPAAGDLDNTDNGHSDTNDNIPLSITIAAPPSSKQPGITKARRDQQSTLHHVHALALLMNGVYRNRLVDEEAVRAVALSLVPVHLVDGFRSRRVMSGAKRGTLSSASSSARGDASSDTTVATSSTTTVDALAVEFMARMQDLIDWFMAEFQVTANAACGEVEHTPQTEEALIACMAARRGCASLVAMVFVAVCRALALETRLVVSLQPVACRVGQANTVERLRAAAMGVAVTRTAPKVATSKAAPLSSAGPSEELAATEATEQASSHSATNSSTPPSRGRRRDKKPSPTALPPSRLLPPHTWIEVLYPLGRRWIPVDVLRARVNPDPKQMDPPRSSAFNTLVYAIAFEPCSDRAKDVTARYARDMRMLVKGFRGAGEMRTWLGDVVRQSLLFRRDLPRDVELDREEDAWLAERTDIAVSAAHQTTTDANGLVTTTPPTTISAYLNHPHYVLERHLKKYEYLHPRDPALIVGQIRTENIWPRSCVQMLHTSDKWLSLEARVVRFGEEPVKVVKSRVMPRKGGIRDLSRVDDEGVCYVLCSWLRLLCPTYVSACVFCLRFYTHRP